MGNKKNYVTTTKSFPDPDKASKKIVGATISSNFKQTLSPLVNMNELSAGVNYSKLLSESFSKLAKASEPLVGAYISGNFKEALSSFAKISEVDNIFAGIKINNDGTINCLDEKNIDVETTLNEIGETISKNTKLSFKQSINNLPKRHKYAWIFFVFLFNLLILQPLYSSSSDIIKEKVGIIIKNLSNSNQKVVAKKVKKPVYAELNKQITDKNIRDAIINNYSFVTINDLNVRSSNSIKSSSIYKLSLGQVVRILHKNKNWTRIEYENEDESIIIRGWVNTRYISKFK